MIIKFFFKFCSIILTIEGDFHNNFKKFVISKFKKEDKANVAKYAQIVFRKYTEGAYSKYIKNSQSIQNMFIRWEFFANVKLNQKFMKLQKKKSMLYQEWMMVDYRLVLDFISTKKLKKPIIEK